MIYLVPYNTAVNIEGITLITRGALDFKANPTLAAGDVQRSIDGGSFSNMGSLPTVTPAGGTSVRLIVSATETLGKRIKVIFIDQTGPKEWEDKEVTLETYGHADSAHPAIGNISASDIAAIKTKTDSLSFISGDVVATLDGESVSTTANSEVILSGERFADFTETDY